MLKENRFTRYFIYALGEIVLVVIGILIALQLNELKDQRIENEQERRILTEMLSNLRLDSIDMSGNIDRNMKIFRGSEAVLRQLEEQIAWKDTMAEHYGSLFGGSLVAPILSSYENLKSIGFDLIKNDSLRAMIHKLYAQQYPFVTRIEQEYREATRFSLVSPQLIKKTISVGRGKVKPLDLNALMNDHEFKESIRANLNAQRSIVYFYGRLLELDIELIHAIEAELEKES